VVNHPGSRKDEVRMAEQGDQWKTSTRGDQAWKETMERVSTRNAETRKAGRIERETYEKDRAEMRRAGVARRTAATAKRPKS
jgi:hypothetical protein